jgi:1-acyl-sn-glycerol-3-phosphate acyltransferase
MHRAAYATGVEPLYDVARVALLGPMRLGVRWTIEGAHRIPIHGPAIVASNHVSYLDPLALGYLADVRHRRVRFLAKAELFDKAGLGWALHQIHQIPVARNSEGAATALDPAVAALRSGECITVFPEGTISLDLEPMAGKTGTARLAAESGVPVIPVGVWGLHRILFKGRRPQWRWGVAETMVVGDPGRVQPGDDVYEATDRIMSAIATCVARAREIYPQRPTEGEDAWWVRTPATAKLRPALRTADGVPE